MIKKIFLVLLLLIVAFVILKVVKNRMGNTNEEAFVALDTVTEQVEVSVDFAAPLKVNNQIGFLHGLGATVPPDKVIKPLSPRLFRTGANWREIFDRANALGAHLSVNMGEEWGFPAWTKGWTSPYVEKEKWVEKVKATTLEVVEKSRAYEAKYSKKPQTIYFDIWNEPNGHEYWVNTAGKKANTVSLDPEFLEAYAVANKVVRETYENATGEHAFILGPSINRYDAAMLETFMNFAAERGLVVDGLSYHEYRTGEELNNVSSSLLEVRRKYIDAPSAAHKAVGVKEIHVNESMNAEEDLIPGFALSMLAELEEGRADIASKSGFEDDWKNNLDGLVSEKDGSLRSVYYAYVAYALGVDSRVASKVPDGAAVRVLASSHIKNPNGIDQAEVLVAKFPTTAPKNGKSIVRIKLSNVSHLSFLKGERQVRAMMHRVKPTERQAVQLPAVEKTEVLTIDTNGDAYLEIEVGTGEVVGIRLADNDT
jgi:xylan 1,4-beta-xylosidase